MIEIYSVYQTFSKRYCELQRIAGAHGEVILKPTKAYRWGDHKLRVVRIGLNHYRPLISHIRSVINKLATKKKSSTFILNF